MKKDILKIAGVKSEKEFYKKFPTEEAFMKAHGKAFKKAAMGKSMVKTQLTQLTDFANPPQAQMGAYIGGESMDYQPFDFRGVYDQLDYSITGKTDAMRAEEARLAQLSAEEEEQDNEQVSQNQEQAASSSKKKDDMQQKIAIGMKVAGAAAGVPIFKRGGKKIPKSQVGDEIPSAVDSAFGLGEPMNLTGATNPNPYAYQQFPVGQQQPGGQQQPKKQKSLATTAGGRLLDFGVEKLAGPLAPAIGQVINAGRRVNQSIKQAAQTRQASGLAKLSLKASSTRPEETQRKYAPIIPGMSGGYGTGTDFLAEDGATIGGNLTEIQNMYNPGNLYSDLGYEPLYDSSKVKQYKKGGHIKIANNGFDLNLAGGVSDQAVSVANKIGQGADFAGNVISGFIDMGTERRMKQNQQLLGQAAFQQGSQSLQNQYGSFMRDGGGLKYLSHDWQPQLITKFGDYDLKDLLAPPKDADMLRAGGHLKSYTPPSASAMSTERPEMALGGNLKTTWGGYAETLSRNPYLPGTGETVMFRGKSHDESDGNGHTGIGVKYGDGAHDSYTDYAEYGTRQADADVEVERNESAAELIDPETGESNLTVYGNMVSPSYVLSELTHPKFKGKNKLKGMKFKHIAKEYSKQEEKDNKTMEKAADLANSVDGYSNDDLLKLKTAEAMIMGADMSMKLSAYDKNMLAGGQNAILETAEERGLEADALAKGKIKPAKDSDMAKFGAKLETAQNGIVQYLTSQKQDASFANRKKLAQIHGIKNYKGTAAQNTELLKAIKSKVNTPTAQQAVEDVPLELVDVPLQPFDSRRDFSLPPTSPLVKFRNISPTTDQPVLTDKTEESDKGPSFFDKALDLYGDLYPYIKPGIRNPLDPNQLMGEMYALSTNQLEPVQAQTYTPILEDITSISLQDQLNEIQAQASAAMRLTGNNPAAQAAIASQAAAAKNKVLGEQLRLNQQLELETKRRNIATLNDATVKNLAIIDQQYQRQAQAKSATKAQAFEALSSIAEKIGKNKSETFAANVMANMYPQFSYGPQGRIYSTGLASWNIPQDIGAGITAKDEKGNDLIPIYGKSMSDIKGYKVKNTAKNGSIVKAIKNL